MQFPAVVGDEIWLHIAQGYSLGQCCAIASLIVGLYF